MPRIGVVVALAGLLVLAGCQAPVSESPATTTSPTGQPSVGTTTQTTVNSPTSTTAGQPTRDDIADPATDVRGWEAGYWHNESIAVTISDGLNESERIATVARAMARVEVLREMEFDRTVPIETISRETFQSGNLTGGEVSEALRTFDDTKFEALFLVGENEDSIAVQESNRGSTVQGFYAPSSDRIVIVSDSATPTLDEPTLAHELVHALQYRNFDANLSGTTRDSANAHKGLIEGSAQLITQQYRSRCGVTWQCVLPAADGGGGGGDIHLGIYIMKFFPYSDGPNFVRHFLRAGGWARVADLYEAIPETSEQVAIPAKYGTDQPSEVSLPDRSTADWERVILTTRPSYGEVGVAGLTAMGAYPAYHDGRPGAVLGPQLFLNRTPAGDISRTDPFNYVSSPIDGWDGERLYVYERADGETAYVWRLVWDRPGDAKEFRSMYHAVLRYWGGERQGDGVWRIPEGESPFADAFRVTRDGDTVTIVNAPTQAELDEVHDHTSG